MPTPTPKAPALPSLPARVVGVLRSPRTLFPAVVATPRWAGMLVLTVVVATGASLVLFGTDVGRQALLDQRVDLLEGFGQSIDDARYEELERGTASIVWQQLGLLVAGIPLLTFGIAATAHWLYASSAGSPVSFIQALAVVSHAGAVLTVRYLVLAPWNYLRESLGSPLNLNALFPLFDEGTFPSAWLGTIDLFVLWWMLVLATGLAVLYHRKMRSVAVTLLAAYGVVAMLIAGAKSALGGQ